MWWGRSSRRRIAAIAGGLALGALAAAAAAGPGARAAGPAPVEGTNPEDGTAMHGIRLPSESGEAFLYVLCEDGERNPALWISHPHVIGAPTSPFKVDYAIDGGAREEHWFFVLPNGKSGAFFPRHNAMYEARFGEAPEMFDKSAGSVAADYVRWYDNIYNSIVADFGFGGETARVRLTDTDGETHAYRFNLIQMPDHMPRLSDCYEAPVDLSGGRQ